MFERTISLIGENNLNKIKNTKILIVGIGGVGGTALECLIRSGVENITIIDYDTFADSNLNRQILSLNTNINKNKTDIAKERCLDINKDANITVINKRLTSDFKLDKYDYIVDACDSIDAKIYLIKYSYENNIKIISSMGMGNRLDPTKVNITKLSKTENDPLAKKIRYELRKEDISLNIPVVSSAEIPLKSSIITSMMMVPSTAGIYMAHYIINDIIT